jgi:hypothetical protein
MPKLQKPHLPSAIRVPDAVVLAAAHLREAVSLAYWHTLLRSRPASEWAAAAWAAAFLHHWSDTLREDCDRHCVLDWASELYPTHGHLRAEEVAQAEWESLFEEEDAAEDDAA